MADRDASATSPQITFGMIVLNGEPFVRYNLRAIYPYAHQIIVVEGAAKTATGVATEDGHSRDSTLSTIRNFMEEEDPENKVVLVTAEDEGYSDGFWPGEKDEQSQAYAKRATGNYLWQVDCDEFYLPTAMQKMIDYLSDHPETTAVSFHQRAFWGDVDIEVDSHYLRFGGSVFHRLFRWAPGYTYATHRPPTVLDQEGNDMRDLHHLDWKRTQQLGIELLHYSLLFPKQVREKCEYYATADWAAFPEATRWAERNYMSIGSPWKVYNVYNHLSWLQAYSGDVPDNVRQMIADIKANKTEIELRNNDDARQLLRSLKFKFTRFLVIRSVGPHRLARKVFYRLPYSLRELIRNVFRPLFISITKRHFR